MIYNQVSALRNFQREREYLCNVIERGGVKIANRNSERESERGVKGEGRGRGG